MRARLGLSLLGAAVLALTLASPALAVDSGEGLLGEVDDVVITFFSLGVVVFFMVLPLVASLVQARLDRRKEQKGAALREHIGS